MNTRNLRFKHNQNNYIVRVVGDDCSSISIKPFRIESGKEVLVSPITYDIPGDVAFSANQSGLDLVGDLLEQAKREVIDDTWGQYQNALRSADNSFMACLTRMSEIFQPLDDSTGSFIDSLVGVPSLKRYQEARKQVAEALNTPKPQAFTGNYDSEDTEMGDLSDLWQVATEKMFPVDKISVEAGVSPDTRKKWCEFILAHFDRSVDLEAQNNDAPWPTVDMTNIELPK